MEPQCQNMPSASEEFSLEKIQWALFVFILLPWLLQTIILVMLHSHVDSEDQQPPTSAALTKWYDSNEDSYGSLCPKDKKYLCQRPPAIPMEEKFHESLSDDSIGDALRTISKTTCPV